MVTLGKILALIGALLFVAGIVMWLVGKTGFRGLPGDIHIEDENFSFYFPIVTCLVISAVVTGLAWLIRHWLKH